MDYILSVLFGFALDTKTGRLLSNNDQKDSIWQLTPIQARQCVTQLLEKYVDSRVLLFTSMYVPTHLATWVTESTFLKQNRLPVTQQSKWLAFSFADPLKAISPLIFGLPYLTLLGDTTESRIQRETHSSVTFDKCGSKNGRQALEFLGSDVFRNHFDTAIWISIFQRRVEQAFAKGYNVVVSDVRFANEYETFKTLHATVLTLARQPQDLDLTDEDRTTHPSKWHFLTFYDKTHVILNNGNFEALYAKVQPYIKSLL
jgi:hypothetical protein